MRTINRRATRTAIARHCLEHPADNLVDVGAAIGCNSSQVSLLLGEQGPRKLLETFGEDLATEERICAALEGGLRICYEHAEDRRKREERMRARAQAAAALVAHPKEYLSAHECQMLTGPRTFCGKSVTGLYCLEHDKVAATQARLRFEQARSR